MKTYEEERDTNFIRLTKEGVYGQFFYIYVNKNSIDIIEPVHTINQAVRAVIKVKKEAHNVYETVDEIMELIAE